MSLLHTQQTLNSRPCSRGRPFTDGRVLLRTARTCAHATDALPHRSELLEPLVEQDIGCQANQPSTRRHILTGLAASVGLACAAQLAVCDPAAIAISSNQLLFLEAWRAVDRAYVDKTFNNQTWFKVREQFLKQEPMESRPQVYAAIKKLLATLNDPFTRFLDPNQYTTVRSGAQGSVTGVGVEIAFDAKQGTASEVVVLAVAEGGPAERGGIRAGDSIAAIEGVQTPGLSLYEAGGMLQGEAGSEVVLEVRSPGGQSRGVTLVREKINSVPASWAVCPSTGPGVGGPGGPVGYLRVPGFSSKTTEAVQQALLQLKAGGAQEYVLDIRNNFGGLFPAGVSLARMFLSSGDVVLIADSSGVKDIYSAEGVTLLPDAPLAVLVNEGTASASEVLAGALKDNGRATIVGGQTFGKGLIQTLLPLSDGSAVTITVAKYQTPAGVDINKVGITPDLPLPPPGLPSRPQDFCSAIAADDAPRLFR